MNLKYVFCIVAIFSMFTTSCVSKKQFTAKQLELDQANKDLGRLGEELHASLNRAEVCEEQKRNLQSELRTCKNSLELRAEQMDDLRDQLTDVKNQRDKQVTQVGDLTVLSTEANKNIGETLSQLERKDKYIQLLNAAKTKADSLNLALAVNLKGVLKDGLDDEDVEIKVDKTVVFVNLSDKMLYQSGSSKLTPRAYDVLRKVAQIINDRPNLEVMVEGYTDDRPISNSCIEDNWDLSVKRSTSVVRVLQKNFSVDPNRLIAAGRGEYNALATNDTAEGRSTNRRTRIIILPKLNEFYDLLNPDMAKK